MPSRRRSKQWAAPPLARQRCSASAVAPCSTASASGASPPLDRRERTTRSYLLARRTPRPPALLAATRAPLTTSFHSIVHSLRSQPRRREDANEVASAERWP